MRSEARAIAVPGSDGTGQDALDVAAEEPFEDLACPLHDCLGVFGPNQFVVDVDTKEFEALNLLHYSPVDENGDVLGAYLSTIISLVLVTLRDRLLFWHHPARSLTSSL